MNTEIWFDVEYSRKNQNDWFATTASGFDSVEAAKKRVVEKAMQFGDAYDYRVVKKTLTSEPL